MSLDKPHDAFFRGVFGQARHAASLFRAFLPAEVVARLDLDAAAPCPDHFVDEKLADFETDLLYAVPFDRQTAFLYALAEHQSTPPPDLPLRLFLYEARIWGKWRADKPKSASVPIILPIVLYHGTRPWRVPRRLTDAFDAPRAVVDALRPFVPESRYLLVDLARVRDEKLDAAESTALARAALLALKHGPAPDVLARLDERLPLLRAIAQQPVVGTRDLLLVLKYLVTVNRRIERADVSRWAKAVDPDSERIVMSLAQDWLEEGRAQGRAEGRAQGRAQGRAEGYAEALLKQIQLRFGVPDEAIAIRVRGASDAELDRWIELIVTADSIQTLFGDSD